MGSKWVARVEEILSAKQNNAYSQDDVDKYGLSDSNFSDPRQGDAQESEAAGGGCFVATAVYGGEDHFNLIVLRSFRDNFLEEYSIGRKFIQFYYEYGPKLAKSVSKYNLLRTLFKPLVNLGVYTVKLFRLG